MDGGGEDREMFLRSCDCVKSSHIFCSSSRSTASHNPTAAAVQKTAQKTAPSRSPSYSQSSKNQINQRPPLEVSLSLAPGKITHSLASGWLAASHLWLSQIAKSEASASTATLFGSRLRRVPTKVIGPMGSMWPNCSGERAAARNEPVRSRVLHGQLGVGVQNGTPSHHARIMLALPSSPAQAPENSHR